jgi:hypothetical protein
MLRKRAAPAMIVQWNIPVTVDIEEEAGKRKVGMRAAFNRRTKLWVLQQLKTRVNLALRVPTLKPTEANTFRTFDHAINWGMLLIKAKGEPEPLLEARTLLHRGVHD